MRITINDREARVMTEALTDLRVTLRKVGGVQYTHDRFCELHENGIISEGRMNNYYAICDVLQMMNAATTY